MSPGLPGLFLLARLVFAYAVNRGYTSKDYVNTSSPGYIYYVRKHNGVVIHDAIAFVPSRLAWIRNFNDFAVDANAPTLPQWVWVTPNMIDGHDITIDYAAAFILVPLLNNTNVNDNRTLIVLSFDENESYTESNQILTLVTSPAGEWKHLANGYSSVRVFALGGTVSTRGTSMSEGLSRLTPAASVWLQKFRPM